MTITNNPLNNVDTTEIAKFEHLAERWWDTEGEFKPLHAINPLRNHYIDRFCHLAEKTVLDVGCGGGILTESMAHRGAIVTGIDMGNKPLAVAKAHASMSQLNINYQQTTSEAYAEKHAESFDVITCLEMLEHVPDPSSVVQSCAKLVKPNGWLFFSTLNRNLKSYLHAIIGAEYLLGLLPKGTHDYQKFIKPSELNRMCLNAGLTIIDLTGMTYNPLTQHYTLNAKALDVNYLCACRKLSE